MTNVRPTAVAGAFYPGDAKDLSQMLDHFIEQAQPPALRQPPKAIIAPHAGYIYSGAVAASVYSLFKDADHITRIILLGPAHRIPFKGLAASSADFFETPLGNVKIDKDSFELIKDLPQITTLDEAHALEHSLEVHLPFFQKLLPNAVVLPLVVGDANIDDVAEVLHSLWGGAETLIVVSSDLSHYLAYEIAKKIDVVTSKAIEELKPQNIRTEQACGARPIHGLLKVASEKGLKAKNNRSQKLRRYRRPKGSGGRIWSLYLRRVVIQRTFKISF